jgi:glycosyltransferase involved in cell wall biosynthesis
MSLTGSVSAIVTVYNEERYIGEAIESVLAQSHPPSQVVVIDNGSTDSSVEAARRYEPEVEVVVEHRRGIATVRNTGLRLASCQYLAFLDGDDIWEPRKTEVQLDAILSGGADLVMGHVRQFASPDVDPETIARLRVPEAPQPGMVPSALLASRRVWERVGPWSPEYVVSDGLDWFLRARRLELRERLLPDVVLRRRVHGKNSSLRERGHRTEFARLLKKEIDRRRAAGGDRSSS